MLKILIFSLFFLFILGCKLTTEKIIADPSLVERDCNKIKDIESKNSCFFNYAEMLASIDSSVSLEICEKDGVNRNKCIFNVFLNLEKNGKIEEAIKVCKTIEKDGFNEWCDSRKGRESIKVAPPLE